MQHQMKLSALAFEQVSNGTKIYEIRLYDKKRQKIKIGDRITFSKLPSLEEKIEVTVQDIIKSENFEELLTKFSPVLAGWTKNCKPNKCSKDLLKYFPPEGQNKHGVVAIEIKVG